MAVVKNFSPAIKFGDTLIPVDSISFRASTTFNSDKMHRETNPNYSEGTAIITWSRTNESIVRLGEVEIRSVGPGRHTINAVITKKTVTVNAECTVQVEVEFRTNSVFVEISPLQTLSEFIEEVLNDD